METVHDLLMRLNVGDFLISKQEGSPRLQVGWLIGMPEKTKGPGGWETTGNMHRMIGLNNGNILVYVVSQNGMQPVWFLMSRCGPFDNPTFVRLASSYGRGGQDDDVNFTLDGVQYSFTDIGRHMCESSEGAPLPDGRDVANSVLIGEGNKAMIHFGVPKSTEFVVFSGEQVDVEDLFQIEG